MPRQDRLPDEIWDPVRRTKLDQLAVFAQKWSYNWENRKFSVLTMAGCAAVTGALGFSALSWTIMLPSLAYDTGNGFSAGVIASADIVISAGAIGAGTLTRRIYRSLS